MARQVYADNVDANGKAFETVGENIRNGARSGELLNYEEILEKINALDPEISALQGDVTENKSDIKKNSDDIGLLNENISSIDDEIYSKVLLTEKLDDWNSWIIQSGGWRLFDTSKKIIRYKNIKEGEILSIDTLLSFCFSSDESMPAERDVSNPYLVGKVYNSGYTGYLIVPKEAKYLFCTSEINKTISVYRNISNIKDNSKKIEDIENKLNYDSDSAIICWGDSLTSGTGSNNSKPITDTNADTSYPAVLSRMINKEVKNYGIGGEPSWMISARSGHNEISVEPFTIPNEVTPKRVYLHGQEQDYFYDNAQDKWTFLKNNLSYNIAVDNDSGVNPCYIDGIKGNLTRTLLSSGETDPDTGEAVQSSVYAYYFTRAEQGEEKTLICRTPIVTNAFKIYDNNIKIIWMGQNDAPLHSGNYITQGSAKDRAKSMCNGKHIVMSLSTGSSSDNAVREQEFSAEFGANYLNIRAYICKNGVDYANSLGANIVLSNDDKSLIENGTIPSCLRSDTVHGNYWYYQIVAKAVYDKGKALGYW